MNGVMMIVSKLKIFISIFFLSVLSQSACANESINTVRVPVLNVCKEDAKSRISKLPKKVDVDAVFIDFDRLLRTHPALVGQIEVSSSKYSRDYLVSVANGFIVECEVTKTLEFDKNISGEGEAFFDFIRSIENTKNQIYIVNEDKVIRVLYRE